MLIFPSFFPQRLPLKETASDPAVSLASRLWQALPNHNLAQKERLAGARHVKPAEIIGEGITLGSKPLAGQTA